MGKEARHKERKNGRTEEEDRKKRGRDVPFVPFLFFRSSVPLGQFIYCPPFTSTTCPVT
jgi:hypothetical protein